MLNVYQLHTNPDQLKGYDQAHERIPKFVWERFQAQPEQLKKREHVLAKDPQYAYQYAFMILDGRFPEGENAIAQSPEYSFRYAKNILGSRFPEGEDAIATNTHYAYRYARYMLHDRFPKGEDTIAQDAFYAFRYAINVLNDRFLKGEGAIKQDRRLYQDQKLWNKYKQYFQLSDSF